MNVQPIEKVEKIKQTKKKTKMMESPKRIPLMMIFLIYLIVHFHLFENANGLRVAGTNGTGTSEEKGEEGRILVPPRLEGNELRAVVGGAGQRRRTTPRPDHGRRKTNGTNGDDEGSYYDDDDDDDDEEGGENDKRVDPSVGPIILPPSLETIENSDTEEDEDDSKELHPAPNRAGNCHSLAHLCHQHSYRRLLQRFCQTTCGRDNCLDQREDLCMHWKRRGFCTHQFYAKMRWRCSRTCGICHPIHP